MKNLLTFGVIAMMLSLPETLSAQVKLPPASSSQTLVQGLGITKATLTYNRPNANNRKIFGGLVPFGEVWRTGANNVPVLETEGDLLIGGQKLPAGTYGLLTIPGEREWTIILSKNAKQWGAYTYNQEEDVFRVTAPATQLPKKIETFTIEFTDVTAKAANLNLRWDRTEVTIPLSFDQDEEIMAAIESGMNGSGNKPYLQAAQYYYNNNKNINQALDWINEAQKANPQAVHIYYWKARIQLKAGDRAGAIATATEGIERATKAQNSEYVKLNTQVLEEAKR